MHLLTLWHWPFTFHPQNHIIITAGYPKIISYTNFGIFPFLSLRQTNKQKDGRTQRTPTDWVVWAITQEIHKIRPNPIQPDLPNPTHAWTKPTANSISLMLSSYRSTVGSSPVQSCRCWSLLRVQLRRVCVDKRVSRGFRSSVADFVRRCRSEWQ